MTKINVFVFAAHHLSGNIAAQRFKGLLKYLDPAKYRIFVFARGTATGTGTTRSATGNVTIFALPGHCVGSESSAAASLLTLASAFLRPLPLLLGNSSGQRRPWLVQALAKADRLCAEKRATGERCAVIGTYSPIDALVAAASLASRHRIGCMQDFRDGLVYEPLGRPGRLHALARQMVERRVVAPATLISSVSRPLVDDFQRRYPHKTTINLPNGFDPEDFASPADSSGSARQAAAILARHVPPGAQLIGHFGRIGASDGSASDSLDYLIDALNDSADATAGRHLMFVGELTPRERTSIERARFSVSVLEPVERALALQLMKRCDTLLLLTGSRTSCATGKLFEYLAAGAAIVCISAVPNEATAILGETGAGRTLLTSTTTGAEALRAALSPPAADARRDVSAYSRVAQAGALDRWISQMVTA